VVTVVALNGTTAIWVTRSLGIRAGALGSGSTPSWGLSLSLSPAVVFSWRRVGNEVPVSISEPGMSGRQQLAAISRSMADLQHEHYGRDSTEVNAYAIKDMIVVVARLTHRTPLEQSMVDGGEPERVLALRANFSRVMAGRYILSVEQLTGRTVVALLSQAHVDPDVIVEAFFLDRRLGVTEGPADVIHLPGAVDARSDGPERLD
jgi:uncharacterized protein YbcI